jgi:hypothetical protein
MPDLLAFTNSLGGLGHWARLDRQTSVAISEIGKIFAKSKTMIRNQLVGDEAKQIRRKPVENTKQWKKLQVSIKGFAVSAAKR